MKLFIQVLDDSNGVRFQEMLNVPAEMFTAPDSHEVTLDGVKLALDYAWAERRKKAGK